MTFFEIYMIGAAVIVTMMVILWLVSVAIKNVSIVDIFWGFGFVLAAIVYFIYGEGFETRKTVVLVLVIIWGLRLSIYLGSRNLGKGEDFRYQEFRRNYGEKRYWWVSFFQTFLLQGILMWLVSAPLLGAMMHSGNNALNWLDMIAIIVWIIGFSFEAGGDWQLSQFKSDPRNKGKVLDKGFWRYTRHPNYFGDSAVWWSFGLFSLAGGSYWPVLGSVVMTVLIIKVSGVSLLERSLKENKPEYNEYVRRTSSFLPMLPKK